MPLSRYLWLLLCYAQCARSNLLVDYDQLASSYLSPKPPSFVPLPINLGVDKESGCICRANDKVKTVVCFGGYGCKKFPQVIPCKTLRVRTTVIEEILVGNLDSQHSLQILELEANHQLRYIEPGAFRNLSSLEQLSISFTTALRYIEEHTFLGLTKLKNLTLVNNCFTNILKITPALHPKILPALESLDLSENMFGNITQDAFKPMIGSKLKTLDLNLCQMDYIHPESFLPLKMLKELTIGENDIDPIIIANFIQMMSENDINLVHLDISGMAFRRHPPKQLLDVIANTTIRRLILAMNQFEIIFRSSFPRMANIEVLDLRKVSAVHVEPDAFSPDIFPNLKALFLNDNYLPGIHSEYTSSQIRLLDLSRNTDAANSLVYFEVDRNTFAMSSELRILNMGYNTIKSIYDYTFNGLINLKLLNMENGTIYYIGNGTFKTTPSLEILNLANNPLTATTDLSSAQFEGLTELKILIMKSCGIKYFRVEDNIFTVMPNLTHLILRNNLLYYIIPALLDPLQKLEVLDLSENLFMAWGQPLFYPDGAKVHKFYLRNNKLSHFSMNMLQDINYLLDNNRTEVLVDLRDNIFVCDCNSMFNTHTWIDNNGSSALKEYFFNSNFQCSTPDVWEDRTVADYLKSIQTVRCIIYNKISGAMWMMWTTPTIILVTFVILSAYIFVRYRAYLRYWLFLAKLALGRRLIKSTQKAGIRPAINKYDAFVSYSNEDRDFVVEMISHMETEPPFLKLCVYERDFEIGSFISESILQSINESKYIVLIVSDSFARSQWCRWETQLAEYHRIFLEDGSAYDPLILIRVGDIDNKHITTTLKYLLKTKVYLSWNEQNAEEFWNKLRNILVKKSDPLESCVRAGFGKGKYIDCLRGDNIHSFTDTFYSVSELRSTNVMSMNMDYSKLSLLKYWRYF